MLDATDAVWQLGCGEVSAMATTSPELGNLDRTQVFWIGNLLPSVCTHSGFQNVPHGGAGSGCPFESVLSYGASMLTAFLF